MHNPVPDLVRFFFFALYMYVFVILFFFIINSYFIYALLYFSWYLFTENDKRKYLMHYSCFFAWLRYLPSALPAVPILSILISPKYEPALREAITVLPLSATTCSRPRLTIYISLPTSPRFWFFAFFIFYLNVRRNGKICCLIFYHVN